MVAAVLPAAVFYYLEIVPSLLASYSLGLAAVFVLFVGWVLCFRPFFSGLRRSPDSNAALHRLAGEIRTTLLLEKISVLRFEGIWEYNFPKVIIICASNDALRQLNDSGLLGRIAKRVGDGVKGDPTFGIDLRSFDECQGVWAANPSYHTIGQAGALELTAGLEAQHGDTAMARQSEEWRPLPTSSASSSGNRIVRTLDGEMILYKNCDLKSAIVGSLTSGIEIQLGSVSVVDGREWVEAALPNGDRCYALGPSVRSHCAGW